MGPIKLHPLLAATQNHVVSALIRFNVALVAVALGQKYGLSTVSIALVVNLAFLCPAVLEMGNGMYQNSRSEIIINTTDATKDTISKEARGVEACMARSEMIANNNRRVEQTCKYR